MELLNRMELAKSFSPQDIEQKWYQYWENNQYFKANIDENKDSYCIMLPPPNVTGTLHMGHAFQDTLMDILIRYNRMQGKNVLWQPGTDHAGIATQMVVERQLGLENITRHDLGREKFVEKVWEWKETSGGSITRQMRRLGASCDWSRERFTMDEGLSKAVTEVFVSLFEQGLIYRGKRLVNWDTVLQTALSDLEVISEEENGSMWEINYPLADGSGFITVATTRPETLLGDSAVAVSADDERYQHLIGKMAVLPLSNRHIPIIADEYVKSEFGTGCVKITPAHDFNDYQVGQRHNLPQINIFTLDGKLLNSAEVPEKYQDLDRFTARKEMLKDLETLGLLVATKPHKLMIPRGDRSNSVIEPMLTDQWFVSMQSMADRGLEVVRNGEIKFVPENWTNTYYQWLENIQDWCISRQLWWGHRIPAWFDENGKIYVARTLEEAQKQAGNQILTQDQDVLDTWFSSALWCFSTLGWDGSKDQNLPELKAFLPSSTLVTGFDIIFFWVARMIMMTLHFTDKVPFKTVYVHGLVRDNEGQKMSKSKGNVLDPIDLIDGIQLDTLVEKRTSNLMNPKQAQEIEKKTRKDFANGIQAFGTDALRFTFASLATNGRDIKFDLKRCEGYRNFCNKLWNATRFVMMNCDNKPAITIPNENDYSFADRWILFRLQEVIAEVRRHFDEFRFDLASQAIYEFAWEEFCDWKLELAKVRFQNEENDPAGANATRYVVASVLETILRLAHPIMPFISEELWQTVASLLGAKNNDSVINATYPEVNQAILNSAEFKAGIDRMTELKGVINACRNLRGEMTISPAQKVPLSIALTQDDLELSQKLGLFKPYLMLLAKLSDSVIIQENQLLDDAPTLIIPEMPSVKLQIKIEIDREAERQRLSKEIAKLEIEIEKLNKNLNNERFVQKAPAELVAKEKLRLSEFEHLLQKIKNQFEKIR